MSAVLSVPAAKLVALAAGVLERIGCTRDEARIVAEHLVDANLTGHDSHGIVRLARYVDWAERGWLKPAIEPEWVVDTPSLIVLDGRLAFGQRSARLLVETAVARARESGVVLAAMRNGGHVGRLGAYAEIAAEAGLASIHFVNVRRSALVAPFGSRERLLSTAPFAAGIPRREGPPVIVDFATSVVAEGKCLVAARAEKHLPGEPLIGGDGEPTGDPAALYGETIDQPSPDPRAGAGALRAMGLHKGSALAVTCELLAGALTGNGLAVDTEQPLANGMMSILFDPARLGDPEIAAGEVETFCARMTGSTPARGFDRVRLPGDVEREARAARNAAGVPLSPRVARDLRDLGERFDVDASFLAGG